MILAQNSIVIFFRYLILLMPQYKVNAPNKTDSTIKKLFIVSAGKNQKSLKSAVKQGIKKDNAIHK